MGRFIFFLFTLSCLSRLSGQDPFVTEWKVSVGVTIDIPVNPAFNTYKYDVDWDDDGIYDDIALSGDASHTFSAGEVPASGLQKISIRGTYPAIYLNDGPSAPELRKIIQWGDIEWKSMERAFRRASNMTYTATDKPDLHSVTSMSEMFSGASKFDANINDWEVGSIENMNSLFFGASNFNSPLDLWDMSSVKYMSFMFSKATKFNQHLNNWDVSSVITMQDVFSEASSFNKPLNKWNTKEVVITANMFKDAVAFNQPLDSLVTTSFSNLGRMFQGATSFNQPLDEWITTSFSNLRGMFDGASSFDQSLGDWNISGLSWPNALDRLLDGTKLSIANYDSTLINWSGQAVIPRGYTLGASGLGYCASAAAKLVLIRSHGWSFEGDHPGCPSDPFVTTWTTTTANETIEILTNPNHTYNYSIDWENDGIIDETGVAGDISHAYATPDSNHEVAIYGDFPAIYLNNGSIAPKLNKILQWGTIQWQTMEGAFYGATNMTYHATDLPDLSQVTSLASMFRDATALNQPLGNWNTSNITVMTRMFSGATTFNQSLNSWITEKVTDMSWMFNGASAFNKDISSWNTSNVLDMSYMFNHAHDFSRPLNTVNNSWNTEKVTDMTHMFSNAYEFNEDISMWNTSSVTSMKSMFLRAWDFNQSLNTVNNSWNTEKVTDMSGMFQNARDFNGDISMWNTEKVTDMRGMFYIASDFDKDISMWNTSNVLDMSYMFYSARDFNRDISMWKTSKVKNMSHMFYNASDFNQPLNTAGNKWNTESVTDMSYMFYEATTFNRDISAWNTSDVTNMNSMFRDATVFDQDISMWNTSNVLDMSYMFYLAREFNRDISMWNTSSVTNMNSAFLHANTFDYPLGDWNLSSVDDMNSMLAWSGLSQVNYDSTLIGWSQQPILPDSIYLRPEELTYCEGETARRSLIAAPHYWIFIGDDRYCNSSGSCTEITTNTYTQLFENVWNVPQNWSDFRIPDACDEVIIATDKSVVLLFADVFCYTLEIEAGGEIEVDGHELTVTAALPDGN